MDKSPTTFREHSIGQPIEKNYPASIMGDEEEWYRELFEGAFDATFIFSMNGHMIDVNPAACLLTGYSREELLSLEFDDLKARSDDGEGKMLTQAFPYGVEGVSEIFLLRKNGERIAAEFRARRMSLAGRTIFYATARGATGWQSRKTEPETDGESSARIKTILESITESCLSLDREGNIVEINQKASNFFGMPADGMIGHRLWDLFPQAVDSEFYIQFHKAVSEQSPVHFETKSVVRPNAWVEVHAYPTRERLSIYFHDITARKRADEELRANEDRYRDLVEHSALLMCTHDLNGRVLSANNFALQTFGSSEAEIVGKNIRNFLLPEFVPELGVYLEKISREGAAEGLVAVRTPGGGQRILEYHNTLRIVGVESPIVRGIARDITKQKTAESSLRKAVRRLTELETIVSRSPTVAFLCRAEKGWPVEFVSENVSQFGYTPEDFTTGKLSFRSIAHPGDYERVATEVRQFLHEGKTEFTKHYRILTKSGETRWLDDWTWVRRDANGTVTHLQGIVLDCTERERVVDELRKLSHAVEQSPVSVVITDLDGKIEYVNPKFTRITGYTFEEAHGQNPRILKSAESPPEVYRQLWQTIISGGTWCGELHNKKKNGELYWEYASISPITDSFGKPAHFIAVKEDITERKKAEESLHQAEEQLLQSQKMEAVGQLAGGIAHDFNNLLTAIIGYSELLLERLRAEEPLRADVEEIRKAGQRAASLTRQLLAFSRKQVLQPKVFNLNSVVAEIEKMISRLIGEDIELVTLLDPALGNIKADQGQIEQVLLNLVVNSRDAMPHGGKLIVETQNLDVTSREKSADLPAGSYVVLSVADSGEGMDPETKSHIFEPFFTTKGQGKGTGLGLSTVYGIVMQSGGEIRIQSERGQGTICKVFLPRVEGQFQQTETRFPSALAPSGGHTILVVEDEEMVRKLAAQALRLKGYTVLEASNAGEALLICEQHPGDIHLMLTDLIMPRMLGPELAARLKSLRPRMKVLYMSGYADPRIRDSQASEGDLADIQKPFTPDLLVTRVREVIAERSS